MKIYLYDTETESIGTGSLSSAHLKGLLEQAGGQDVEVHISSAGGSAFDAIAMYDMLKKYPAQVTTYVDALAASAASIVAMAGNTIVMSKYALMMIHKPMAGSGGNADDLLRDVQMLNVVQARLAQIYIDRSGLDDITINSLINAVTWMTADQALDLGFIDRVDDYSPAISNSLIISKLTGTAPAIYQQCINKLINNQSQQMNTENKALIDKTTSVLDKIMNFFKRVVNQHTITDKCALHHEGELTEGGEVYQDEELTEPAEDDTYTTASGKKITVKNGLAEKILPAEADEEHDEKAKPSAKKSTTQTQVDELKAKLHAQNSLLSEARAALESATQRLHKTRDEVRNEIRSDFVPQTSKRSAKAKTEQSAFFAPQSALAQNAVKKAVQDKQ
jgi:ATP-dependent Clp protease, protease subunit